MLARRIIPCLDVKNGRTVKGTKFENLRDAGDPVHLAAQYSDEGADELVLLDISASQEGRKTFLKIVNDVAKALQIPFTVGGGISTADDIRRALDSGADKVSLNSAILARPDLLQEAAALLGSQSIVAAIDVRRENGHWGVWSKGGTERTGKDALQWAVEAVEKGAGELLVTSMDRDGTAEGCDVELLRLISGRVRVPLIASGGIGTREHVRQAIVDGHADAVLAASIFHYGVYSLGDIKQFLYSQGIPVRWTSTHSISKSSAG
ncbi:MAG: imidazole glycerol phosphate synthase subunit HisF [Bacteroidota bacterium]